MNNIILKKSKVLFSYKEDIAKQNLKDWLTSHISFLLPIHKYKGEITLYTDQLVLKFKDQTNILTELILTKKDIIEVYYGFDDSFNIGKDRSLGLTFKPLKVNYKKNATEETLYLIIDFNRFGRTSKNREWYDKLLIWIK